MAIIANDTQRYSNVVKHEFEPSWAYCKKMVTLNDAAATLQIGTVLGMVTATGKYKVCEATAVDGSEVAAVILVGNAMGQPLPVVAANNADTQVLVIHRGPAAVSASALTFGASVNTDAEKAAAHAQLDAKGIMVLQTI